MTSIADVNLVELLGFVVSTWEDDGRSAARCGSRANPNRSLRRFYQRGGKQSFPIGLTDHRAFTLRKEASRATSGITDPFASQQRMPKERNEKL
jgi:hypothetical protein